MQIAGPGNRANPLRIVSPTCLRPFRTTIRNHPATQAAAQAIELARFLLLSERRGPISRVGNIKPRVGMSILLASIQITIPRAHRRRLSSILKTPSRRRRSPGYFSYQTNGLPAWHMESNSASSPPAENNAEETPGKEIKTGRKCHNGASFLTPYGGQSSTTTTKPQVANIFNAEFPISPEQHACNEAPLWHFLAETTQQDATARFEREVDNPFTRPQTARASFHPPDRNQSRPAHQIASGTSYVSAHPGPKHLDREAAPAQPAFRTPGISHIAHQAASGTPTPRPPSR